MSAGPYSIGAEKWPGLSKLAEEAGEVLQVIGKIVGANGELEHWDGGPPLDQRLEEEMADVIAAAIYVASACALNRNRIDLRVRAKVALFRQWHVENTTPAPLGETQ